MPGTNYAALLNSEAFRFEVNTLKALQEWRDRTATGTDYATELAASDRTGKVFAIRIIQTIRDSI